MEKQELKLAFSEILEGYSLARSPKYGEIKIKHMNNSDASKTDIKNNYFYKKAISQGLPKKQDQIGKVCLSYLWSKEKDISDLNVMKEICSETNLNFEELKNLSESDEVSKTYENNSSDAVNENVFGAPSFIFNNEIFWGQDRLDYLEDALKK